MKYIRFFLILGLVMQCTAKQKVEQKEVELQNIYNHNLIIYYDREIGKEDLLKSVQIIGQSCSMIMITLME